MSNIQKALSKLIKLQDLSAENAFQVMDDIMDGKVSDPEISAYLMGLAVKKESVSEIVGSARAMIAHATKIEPAFDAIDIVGTGGDLSGTFNISTTASFIVAAAGVPVVKHGNRAASSKSGTADALEALEVMIDLKPEQATSVLSQAGQTFLFARSYHPAMKYVGSIRKTLGVRTIFNILGPLTNPTRPQTMLVGVYSKELLVPLAKVFSELGVRKAILVHGQDGLDEVTLTTKTDLVVLTDGQIKEKIFDPTDYGFDFVSIQTLRGGTPVENAKITHNILSGVITGPMKNIVILNAAMALLIAEKSVTIRDAIKLAEHILDSGKALKQLELLQQVTKEVTP
ncbi:anthranilate phosphoribosyltransferase [Leuconostoc litchii]|uniref:Anthranilate phosphoribosyltransferase n=1 Tax=Leuconostoc litchii TaxID=1981069 RepID=A0A6P2CRP1_9LACO|nr:anthranilate phosphoribosyltransferase [Leuconostoc litchii]TYC46929.1 anthranilate phosphoribosyltransferase [Leuconostoc litchii]GMA68832.1 anthranilate phosphoribosyltransferase [Leuconostoc litchii]